MKSFITLLLSFSALFISCSSTSTLQNNTVQATLWVQNSAEYSALSLQAYSLAEMQLQQALNDLRWTASLLQDEDDIATLPPAVILDIDETVLDNSPFQARMIKKGTGFNIEDWNAWCNEANAEAVDGAVKFTQKAHELGIKVIFISNRDASTEDATRKNMKELGFPIYEDMDNILANGEQEDWNSSKIARRKIIEDNYRVLMNFGDDLNDFLPAKNLSIEERQNLVNENSELFGTRWFVLVNPIYGSWDQAMYNFRYDYSDEERSDIQLKLLNERRN